MTQDEAHDPPDADDAEVSLERLSAAFADLIDAPDDAASPEPSGPRPAPSGSADDVDAGMRVLPRPRDDDEDDELWIDTGEEPLGPSDEVTVQGIIESILFVGHPKNVPISSDQVAAQIRGVSPDEVDSVVRRLNEIYLANGCPYEIIASGGGWRMVLRESFHSVRARFYGRLKQVRLSQAAVECLALVAYNEPLTTEEVNTLRSTESGGVLAQLVRRQLLRVERTEQPPRVTRYYTTRRFLQLFDLDSLEDLPQMQELD